MSLCLHANEPGVMKTGQEIMFCNLYSIKNLTTLLLDKRKCTAFIAWIIKDEIIHIHNTWLLIMVLSLEKKNLKNTN